MQPEDEIQFVGKLLELIHELQELVRDYCRVMCSHDDGHCLENNGKEEYPF